jgi:Hg(II)-responsive transcriptional regulator
MKVSQLAKAGGVGVETVRYYQRIGLLSTPKRAAGFREYESADLARLRFIRRAQALGFTLAEISTLVRLSASNCKDAERIARDRLATVSEKLADLNRIAIVLSEVVARCAARKRHQGCPIIETLVRA